MSYRSHCSSPARGSHASALARLLAPLVLLVLLVAPALAQPVASSEFPELPASELPEIPAAPATLEIPETFEVDYGHNIRITGTPEYLAATIAILDEIGRLPTGAKLFEELGRTGYETRIERIPDAMPGQDKRTPYARALDLERANLRISPFGEETPGPGTDGLIFMDPDFELEGFNPEMFMAHELIHALHYQRGERHTEKRYAGPWGRLTKIEELRTIGVDGFEGEPIHENRLRAEWNVLHPDELLPSRTGHSPYDLGPIQRPVPAEGGAPTSSSGGGAAREGSAQVLERTLNGER